MKAICIIVRNKYEPIESCKYSYVLSNINSIQSFSNVFDLKKNILSVLDYIVFSIFS